MPQLRRVILFPVLLASVVALAQQGPPSTAAAPQMPGVWLQGFVARVSGETIVYPWAYPGQIPTLLSRATDGRMAVEWEGEPCPPGEQDQPVTYLWHAGTASGSGAHRFALSVNGETVATFTSGRTTADRMWVVNGPAGARLSFMTTRVGQFDELFGFMWLTAPRRLFGTEAPRFAVVGEAAGSQDYYLGPQQAVRSWVHVRDEEALAADGTRLVSVGFSHVGPPAAARVLLRGTPAWAGTLSPGYTTVLISAGSNTASVVPVAVTVGDEHAFSGPVTLNVVTPRTIHILPHSHVDIGYSDPQPEVERKQWRNLREAIDLGRKTATNPAGARFKWNVEGLWAVEGYLAQASAAERQAFAEAVRTGIIGLQANYTNVLTGLMTPTELRRWTDAARRIRTTLGVGPVRSAMHSDIPGLAWTSVPALSEAGVRFVSSGPNYVPGLPDGGDRIGETLRALGDKPFWWVSPSGEDRVLFWMAGRGYSWFHGINAGKMADHNRNAILEYVWDLASAGYPYDMIQVRYTIGGDNGPIDPSLPDFVKAWNTTFSSPRLVINTADAMFAEFERKFGSTLPSRAGDMTPYWEDGALSSAGEEAAVRSAARRLHQAEALAAVRGVALPDQTREAAWRHTLLWHEHTWGAADSISAPDRADVVAQWEYKRRFATEASRLSQELLQAALPPPVETPTHIDVINTLARPRSGLILLEADQSRAGDRVELTPPTATEAPRVASSQRLQDGRLAVWLDAVPALAAVRLRVVAGRPGEPSVPARATPNRLENERLRLVLDGARGAVMSLTWAGMPGHDYAAGAPGLFRYFYVDGRDPAQASGFGGGRLVVEETGPLVASVRITGRPGGTAEATLRLTVVAGSDRISAALTIDKLAVRTKESAHVAFPLNLPGGTIRADQGEGFVHVERDQLPGACRDFIGIHSAIDVSTRNRGVTLVSLDAPLIELGAMTDERTGPRHTRTWRSRVEPGSTVYAYLLNNYWHTNYRAEQAGPLRFRFFLQPHGGFDPVAVRERSDDADYPLLVVPSSESTPLLPAPFAIRGDPVVVTSLTAADPGNNKGITLRVFNPRPSSASIVIDAGTRPVHMAGRRGTIVSGGRLTVPPLAVRTVDIAPAGTLPGPRARVPVAVRSPR